MRLLRACPHLSGLATPPSVALNRRALEDGATIERSQNAVTATHFRAVRMLSVTTIFWSLSFPLVKALGILQESLVPGLSTWFHASLTGVVRFGLAALILVPIAWKSLPRFTRSELWEGAGMGFFGGGGILLQMDGLGHTSASTSAFVTQAYCILVPIVVAYRDKVLPSARLIVAVLMMMLGVAILSKFNPRTFQLGRGEAETLLAAVFFAGQILWLERPKFTGNNPLHFSLVMFLVMSGMSAPIVMATWRGPADILTCYTHPGVIMIALSITLFCTVGAFVAMNKWQPFVPSTEAAIIYGAEPVFASLLALFLPALISRGTGIHYPNEKITAQLLTGGLLVIAANLLLQWKWKRRSEE